MNIRPLASFALSTLALAALSAQASISFSSTSDSYAQSFDNLSNNCPRGCTWVDDRTLPGWSLVNSDGKAGAGYLADDGSGLFGGTGGYHSLGSANSTERALGMLPSANAAFGTPSPAVGSVAGWIALSATNDTGAALSGFTLGYSGEEWRPGTSGVPNTLSVQYGFGSSFASVTHWADAGSGFNFNTPVQGPSIFAINGNAEGRVSGLGGTVGGLSWNDGDTLWIRWAGIASGDADSMAIDDLTLTVSAVPEPSSVALMLAGIGALGFVARRRHRG